MTKKNEQAAEKQLQELLNRLELQRKEEEERFLSLINPVLEMVECSYLIRPKTKAYWGQGKEAFRYDMVGIDGGLVIVELGQTSGDFGAEVYLFARFTVRTKKNTQLEEEKDLRDLSVEEVAKTIKLLALKAAVEDSLTQDPLYYEKFFNIPLD